MLGQAGHMQKGGPSRQGLLRKLHHPKRLRTGQPERSGGSAVINGNFNIGEELGRILHLVNEHRQIVHLQKEGGICLGQLALLHIIQRHIISLRRHQPAEHRRLSHLARAGDQDTGIFLRKG